MARRAFDSLSPAYQRRLARSGITAEQYASGASLKAARGHAATPERPTRAFLRPDLYGDYLRRRRIQGKNVPKGILPPEGPPKRFIGDEIGWANRDGLFVAIFTRTPGGTENGDSGVLNIIERIPETGGMRLVSSTTYNQGDFVNLAREMRTKHYVVQVVSVQALGVTA